MNDQGFIDSIETQSKHVHVHVPKYENYFTRHELNQKEIEKKYAMNYNNTDDVLRGVKHYMKKHYKPSPSCMKNFLFDRIPFLRWIIKYDVKQNLLRDFLAGLTIGIIQIPSGLNHF